MVKKPKHFGQFVKNNRQTLGMTQVELAELSRVSQPTISRIENSTSPMTFKVSVLFKVLDILKIRELYLELWLKGVFR